MNWPIQFIKVYHRPYRGGPDIASFGMKCVTRYALKANVKRFFLPRCACLPAASVLLIIFAEKLLEIRHRLKSVAKEGQGFYGYQQLIGSIAAILFFGFGFSSSLRERGSFRLLMTRSTISVHLSLMALLLILMCVYAKMFSSGLFV